MPNRRAALLERVISRIKPVNPIGREAFEAAWQQRDYKRRLEETLRAKRLQLAHCSEEERRKS